MCRASRADESTHRLACTAMSQVRPCQPPGHSAEFQLKLNTSVQVQVYAFCDFCRLCRHGYVRSPGRAQGLRFALSLFINNYFIYFH